MGLGPKRTFLGHYQQAFDHDCHQQTLDNMFRLHRVSPIDAYLAIQQRTRNLGHICEIHRIGRRLGNDKTYQEIIDTVSGFNMQHRLDAEFNEWLDAISTSTGAPLSTRDRDALTAARTDRGRGMFRADWEEARRGDHKLSSALQNLFTTKLKQDPFEKYLRDDSRYPQLLTSLRKLGGFEQFKQAVIQLKQGVTEELKSGRYSCLTEDERKAIGTLVGLADKHCIVSGESLQSMAFSLLEQDHLSLAQSATEAAAESARQLEKRQLLEKAERTAEQSTGKAKWILGGIAVATVALGAFILYDRSKSHAEREEQRRRQNAGQVGALGGARP